MELKPHKNLLSRISKLEISQEKRILIWENKVKRGMATPFAILNLMKLLSKNYSKVTKSIVAKKVLPWYEELDALFSDEMSIYYKHRWLLLLIYEKGLNNTSKILRTKNSDICRYVKEIVKIFHNRLKN